MKLRDYQQQSINNIYQVWNSGNKNVLIQLPTGGGKTVILARVIAELNVPSIVIAHRSEIVSQISLTLAKHGIYHNLIAQKPLIREIISLHMQECKKSFYNPSALNYVAGVDTLLRLDPNTLWFKKIKLVIQDEAHHVLRDNKWGRAAALFPQANGLYPTATPVRADGKGLGKLADGIIDVLVRGASMRYLIDSNFLCDYRIVAPPNSLDLSSVPLAASGDYSLPKLRNAVHESKITGDVVSHYLKFANGKQGITFAVDLKAAAEITEEFKRRGVKAEIISGKTPDTLRYNLMRQFKDKKISQLVNVDLLGEGVDVPAVEVVSMARPTESYALYSQIFGRALRVAPGKDKALIIDHVGNVLRHGLPDDMRRTWTLDRRERKKKNEISIIKTCLECFAVYERFLKCCPQCGAYREPANRSAPEYVDGDLTELSAEALELLRGKMVEENKEPNTYGLDIVIQRSVKKRFEEKQEARRLLSEKIAEWAGYLKAKNKTDSEIYRIFYAEYGIDIANAQLLKTKDANLLRDKICI